MCFQPGVLTSSVGLLLTCGGPFRVSRGMVPMTAGGQKPFYMCSPADTTGAAKASFTPRGTGRFSRALTPVGFQYSATGFDLAFYAARSYSRMRPPSTSRRLIRCWERSAAG
jgi:hypothetical protein